MKKTILLVLTLFSCTLMVSAAPTFNLNGGQWIELTNDALFEDLFREEYTQFATPKATYTNIAGDYVSGKIDTNNKPNGVAGYAENYIIDFVTKPGYGWKWLGDYIKTATPSMEKQTSETYWRYEVQGFFSAIAKHHYLQAGNYTNAGKPEEWGNYYKAGHGPTRENYKFVGWNTNQNATSGTFYNWDDIKSNNNTYYAIWKKVIYFDLNGGTPDPTTMTNSDLWNEFKKDYKTYYNKDISSDTIDKVSEAINRTCKDFVTDNNSSWKWLGDYLISKNSANPNNHGGPEAAWTFLIHRFFNSSESTGSQWLPENDGGNFPISSFENNGKPEIWMPYYMAYYAFTVDFRNKTKKGSDTFTGWYAVDTLYDSYDAVPAGTTLVAIYGGKFIWGDAGETNIPHYEVADDEVAITILTNFAGINDPELTKTWKYHYDAIVLGATSPVTWEIHKKNSDNTFTNVTNDGTNPLNIITYSVANNFKIKITRKDDVLKGGQFRLVAKNANGHSVRKDFWVPTRPKGFKEMDETGKEILNSDPMIKPYVYAYDLRAKYDPVNLLYNFIFNPNATFTTGKIHLHRKYKDANNADQEDTKSFDFHTHPVSYDPDDNHYWVGITDKEIYDGIPNTSVENAQVTWDVELTNDPVEDFGYLRQGVITNGYTGVLAVNKAPLTPTFGRVYTFFNPKTKDANGNPVEASHKESYIFTADVIKEKVAREKAEIYAKRREGVKNSFKDGSRDNFEWDRIARMAIDIEGDVYFSDKGDANPGIFIGRIDQNDTEYMPIYRFFKNNDGSALTIDNTDSYQTDQEAIGISNKHSEWGDRIAYPIIKNGKTEVASAIMAVDTYEKADGTVQLFAYAKGHSPKSHSDANSTGNNHNTYHYDHMVADEKAGYIPYHSILIYELGNIKDPTKDIDTTWNKAPTKVIPIWCNHHVAHTANIWATEKGMWIAHERGLGLQNTWAASLLFYDGLPGDNSEVSNPANTDQLGTYNSGMETYTRNPDGKTYTHHPDRRINGSEGGTLAVNDENTLLVLQNATKQLLVFEIKWKIEKDTEGKVTHRTPTLTLINVYEHDLNGAINQMNFDYAGNLFCAGANGLTVFAFPEVGLYKKDGEKKFETANAEGLTGNHPDKNTSVVPAQERFMLSTELYYDVIFENKNGEGDESWHNPENWKNKYMPHAKDNARIDDHVTISTPNAVVGTIDLNKNRRSNNEVPMVTITPTGSLHYTGTWKENTMNKTDEDILTHTNQKVVSIEDGHPTYVAQGEEPGSSIIKKCDPITDPNLIVIQTNKKTGQLGTLRHNVEIPATVQLSAHGRFKEVTTSPIVDYNPWQHIALPFKQGAAGENFYGTIMYRWRETKRNWLEINDIYLPLYRFNGYLLSHDNKYYPLGDNEEAQPHILKGVLKPYVDEVGTNDENDKNTLDVFTQISTKDENIEKGYRIDKILLAYNAEGEVGQAGVNAGWNYLGNSWTAPIYIQNFELSDFSKTGASEDYEAVIGKPDGAEATIYLYAEDNSLLYQAVPIKLFKELGIDRPVIPALYSFYVRATEPDASLTMDYRRLTTPPVEPVAASEVEPQAVQQRRVKTMQHERMHIGIKGEKGDTDNLYLFEGAQYTNDFDNGYDATKMSGDAAYLAATTELGDMAVLAVPAIEGTYLKFSKNWSTNYTFTFNYNGTDALSLEDMYLNTLTPIATGSTYSFTATDNDASRFRIVRKQDGNDTTTELWNVWANENNLYMDNPTGELVDVKVYSADGQLVLHKQTYESVTTLKVPMHGVYTIQLTTANNVRTIKHIL